MEERGNALRGLRPAWFANAAQRTRRWTAFPVPRSRPSATSCPTWSSPVCSARPSRVRPTTTQTPCSCRSRSLRREGEGACDVLRGAAARPVAICRADGPERKTDTLQPRRSHLSSPAGADDSNAVPIRVPTLTGSLHMPQARLRGPLDLVERRKHLRAEPGCVRRLRRVADSRRPLVHRGSEGLPDGGSSRCRIGS